MRTKETTQLNKSLKAATVKLILGGVGLLLLLSTLIYMTFAWYTKMVSVSGLKFDVAQWDFTANYAQDDFTVNVFNYSTLTSDKVAPGASGYIPLRLGAGQSDTDVSYAISIDRSSMSEEFRARIFFYYMDGSTKKYIGGSPTSPDAGKEPIEGEIKKGTNSELMIYWEWIYEAPTTDADAIAEWDAFDTAVGRNPELYEGDMNATLSVIGVEIKPRETN